MQFRITSRDQNLNEYTKILNEQVFKLNKKTSEKGKEIEDLKRELQERDREYKRNINKLSEDTKQINLLGKIQNRSVNFETIDATQIMTALKKQTVIIKERWIIDATTEIKVHTLEIITIEVEDLVGTGNMVGTDLYLETHNYTVEDREKLAHTKIITEIIEIGHILETETVRETTIIII